MWVSYRKICMHVTIYISLPYIDRNFNSQNCLFFMYNQSDKLQWEVTLFDDKDVDMI